MSYITPVTLPLDLGVYQITVPEFIVIDSKTYHFNKWEDDSVNPQRIINLNQNMSIVMNYGEVICVGDIIIKGTVSHQDAEGQTVTITITKPDASVETLTALTDANKAYQVMKTGLVMGSHQFDVSIPKDSIYSAATASITYDVTEVTRTITVVVEPA